MKPLHSMPYPANSINELNNSHQTSNNTDQYHWWDWEIPDKERDRVHGRKIPWQRKTSAFGEHEFAGNHLHVKSCTPLELFIYSCRNTIINIIITHISTNSPEKRNRWIQNLRLLPPDIQTPSSCRTKEKEHNVKKAA